MKCERCNDNGMIEIGGFNYNVTKISHTVPCLCCRPDAYGKEIAEIKERENVHQN